MAITDTQAKINDIINKSLSANASTLGDVMRNAVASGMQDLLNEIVTMLVELGDLDVTKLENGTYTGNASTLKSYLEGLISACTQKGTYSGTAGQLKAMIDSLATTGTITPDLKNYMELLKNENNVNIVQGVPVGGQKWLGDLISTGAIKIKLPTKATNTMFNIKVIINDYARRKNCVLLLTGYNRVEGFGSSFDSISNCKATVLTNDYNNQIPNVYFCSGETEDYLLIGEITSTLNYGRIVVSDINYSTVPGFTLPDWSTGWNISLVTTLETLDSAKKVAVTPSLNATNLNGTKTSNANYGITQKKTSTQALDIQNDSGTSHFKVNTTNRFTDIKSYISKYKGANVASATTIVPTGEIFHVTGTTAISTITPPTGLTDCMQITIIPDGIFTTTTAGNIALATTAVVNRALIMIYDATTSKWYPSY